MNYNLTTKERRLLRLLEGRDWTAGSDLLLLDGHQTWSTFQGIHQTASSLVRKGMLAKKSSHRSDPRVHYVMLMKGKRALDSAESDLARRTGLGPLTGRVPRS